MVAHKWTACFLHPRIARGKPNLNTASLSSSKENVTAHMGLHVWVLSMWDLRFHRCVNECRRCSTQGGELVWVCLRGCQWKTRERASHPDLCLPFCKCLSADSVSLVWVGWVSSSVDLTSSASLKQHDRDRWGHVAVCLVAWATPAPWWVVYLEEENKKKSCVPQLL